MKVKLIRNDYYGKPEKFNTSHTDVEIGKTYKAEECLLGYVLYIEQDVNNIAIANPVFPKQWCVIIL